MSSQNDSQAPAEWWFRLTAPTLPTNATFTQREAVRRGRLASVTILFISLFACLPLIQALQQNNMGFIFTMVVTLLLNAIALFWLNRRGHLAAAGILTVVVLDLGFALTFLALKGGVSFTNIRGYDVMVEALMVVVAFFPARSVFIVAAINSAFIILWTYFGPHTPEITNALQNPYGFFYPSLSIELFSAVMLFLWVSSALNAIANADRSAEIVELERREIARQQQEIDLQQQVQGGVKALLQTLTQAANGNYTVRAPLNQDNVLWQVGYSLNNLLTRLQKNSQTQQELAQIHHALQTLAQQIEHGEPIQRTGTAVDGVIVAMSTNKNQLPAPQEPKTSSRDLPRPGYPYSRRPQ